MSTLQTRLMPWIVDTTRLSRRQKGSLPRNGLQEHVFCLNSAIRDFLHKSSKLFIAFVDIRDAFGSVNHAFMFRALEQAGYPDWVIELLRNAYDGSNFQVTTNNTLTDPIARQRGIIQGCPISVIAFEQAIDVWLRWVNAEYSTSDIPIPVQGYVDDVSLAAESEEEIRVMTTKTDYFMNAAQMEVKHRKCALLNGQRTGNNWKKNSKTDIDLIIQNSSIPVYSRDQCYKYLGYQIRIDNLSTQVNDLISEFVETLVKIDKSLLPVSAKIEAINTMCMSKLNFFFPNSIFLEKDLDNLENEIVSYVRHWLKLNSSSTRTFMFTPRSKGGLGIINPRVMYYCKHLAFTLHVLNCDDMSVRLAARESLQLHMSKRKAISDLGEGSFAGYATSDGKIVKDSKVNWPKSIWYHVFGMCQRENISLRYSPGSNSYRFEVTLDDETTFNIEHSKAFYNFFKGIKLQSFEDSWKKLSSQGRVARETSGHIDEKCTKIIFSNHNISDEIRCFICRSRLQLLQCNSLIHTYYSTGKHCRVCNNPNDTVSHVLNGCTKLQLFYQKRHNRIVDLVFDKIKSSNKEKRVIKDSIIKPSMFFSTQNQNSFVTKHTRPDIVVIDDENKSVIISEISIPFDAFMGDCFQTKFDKYFPLCNEINELGYYTEIVVLVLGSLGHVHNKFASGLIKNNISKSEAKFLTRYCSVSAIMGSYFSWKQRCRLSP